MIQDGGKDAWKIVLPEKRDEVLSRLFKAHGVNEPSSLNDYLKLCDKRRTERLSSIVKEWAPFAFTEGETIRNSFFGYTEGLF